MDCPLKKKGVTSVKTVQDDIKELLDNFREKKQQALTWDDPKKSSEVAKALKYGTDEEKTIPNPFFTGQAVLN